MSVTPERRQQVLGLVLTLAIGTGAFFVLRWALGVVSSLQDPVAAAVVTTSGTVLLAVITLAIQRTNDRRKAEQADVRKERIPVYKEMLDFFFQLFYSSRLDSSAQKKAQSDMVDFMTKLTPKLIMYGSDEVVRRWGYLRTAFAIPDDDPEKDAKQKNLMLEFEKLMTAMRRDVDSSSKLDPKTILRLWLNDVDEFFLDS